MRFKTGRGRAALLGTLVLVAGSVAGGAALAAPAGTAAVGQAVKAAPAVVTPNLDVGLTSETVIPLVSITVNGTYTCNDTTGAHNVVISVDVSQNDNGGHDASTTVPCQVTNGTFSILVLDVGAQAGVQTNTTAKIEDGGTQAIDGGDMIANRAFASLDPTDTRTRAGAAIITGHYTCDGTTPLKGSVTVDQNQSGTEVGGFAMLNLACPATNATFSATVTPTATALAAGQAAPAASSYQAGEAELLLGMDIGVGLGLLPNIASSSSNVR